MNEGLDCLADESSSELAHAHYDDYSSDGNDPDTADLYREVPAIVPPQIIPVVLPNQSPANLRSIRNSHLEAEGKKRPTPGGSSPGQSHYSRSTNSKPSPGGSSPGLTHASALTCREDALTYASALKCRDEAAPSHLSALKCRDEATSDPFADEIISSANTIAPILRRIGSLKMLQQLPLVERARTLREMRPELMKAIIKRQVVPFEWLMLPEQGRWTDKDCRKFNALLKEEGTGRVHFGFKPISFSSTIMMLP